MELQEQGKWISFLSLFVVFVYFFLLFVGGFVSRFGADVFLVPSRRPGVTFVASFLSSATGAVCGSGGGGGRGRADAERERQREAGRALRLPARTSSVGPSSHTRLGVRDRCILRPLIGRQCRDRPSSSLHAVQPR